MQKCPVGVKNHGVDTSVTADKRTRSAGIIEEARNMPTISRLWHNCPAYRGITIRDERYDNNRLHLVCQSSGLSAVFYVSGESDSKMASFKAMTAACKCCENYKQLRMHAAKMALQRAKEAITGDNRK